MPARARTAIDDRDLGIIVLPEQRVGEGEATGPRPDDQVIGVGPDVRAGTISAARRKRKGPRPGGTGYSLTAVSTSQRLLAAFWILSGINHFRMPEVYESIMPDYVPRHREMVLWSGAAELAGGLLVIPRATRGLGRWWLLGVLAAVYPANVHMALHPERYPKIPPPALWARLPLQLVAAWWVWRATADAEAPA